MVKSRRSASRFQSRPKRHLCATAERLHVFAQRGDLEWPAGRDDGDGAVLDAGGHRFETRRLDPANHLGWNGSRGDIDVAVGFAEQGIPHCSAHDAGFLAGPIQHPKQIAERRLRQPCGVEATRRRGHLDSPGTNWPSSTRAGT